MNFLLMIINEYMKAKAIEIITSDKLKLKGFIFSKQKSKIIYIIIHGLGGNLFSRFDLAEKLVNSAAVMVFNNRGAGIVNRFSKIDNKKGVYSSVQLGSSVENFVDSILDIEAAVKLAGAEGYKKIILLGHSSGSNKIAYYLAHKIKTKVSGGILLAPMSDYALIKKETEPKVLSLALKTAQNLVKINQGDSFLPVKVWPHLISAKRFLSLYLEDSKEEIFSYANPDKKSILKKIKKPIFIILAENDECADRDMGEIKVWFKKVLPAFCRLEIIGGTGHGFYDRANILKNKIAKWSASLK
ncbi:MAG: alpha/beta hydrolase [Patescibacteria group bacterium]|nr:alpha/beta hydrolase [Patescibacteria group bacterium]